MPSALLSEALEHRLPIMGHRVGAGLSSPRPTAYIQSISTLLTNEFTSNLPSVGQQAASQGLVASATVYLSCRRRLVEEQLPPLALLGSRDRTAWATLSVFAPCRPSHPFYHPAGAWRPW